MSSISRWLAARTPAPALALLLAGCVALGRGGARETRLLVYNVHAGKDAAGVDNLERVAALVRESRADIVLLQEVDRHTTRSGRVDQPGVLARLTGLEARLGRTLDYQGGEYGIAVLSRWPIERDTLVHLPVEPPQQRAGGSYEPRGAHVVTVRAPEGPLTIVNTHLDASGADTYRRQEVRAVLELVASRSARGERVLLGGDFNSTPESAVLGALRAAGLRDAWMACGRGDALTYPADSAVKRIDYLFLPARAGCVEARVLRSEASDHRPLFVRLTLP